MTARKRPGFPCHVDDDLAHVGRRPQESPTPCSRRHKAAPAGASSVELAKLGLAPRTAVKLVTEPAKVPRETKSQPPAESETPARSKGKARATHDERTRLGALDLIVSSGIAGAHKATGIPKATLSRWARAAGIDLEQQARERTRAAAAAVEARAAEAALSTVAKLEGILDLELSTHARIAALEAAIGAHLEAAVAQVRAGEPVVEAHVGMMGAPYLVLHHPTSELGQLTGLLELTGKTLSKRDVVGAWTRAVHDLALLKGEATERGTILVRFGIPRPAGDVDAGVVDELDLTAETPAKP